MGCKPRRVDWGPDGVLRREGLVLWRRARRGAGHDEADRVADAKRELFGRILAAVVPARRSDVEGWLTGLIELSEGAGGLVIEAREALVREVLGEAGPDAGAERDYEVAPGGVLMVRARSATEAVARAVREREAEDDDRYAVADPNPWCEVRPAYSRGQWERVYEDHALEGGGRDGPAGRPGGRASRELDGTG